MTRSAGRSATPLSIASARFAPQAGEKILDIATGTGWTARRIAQHGANVTGIDLGTDLIAAAKRVAAQLEFKIDFRVGDAERLPFADGKFDAVISRLSFASRTRRRR